MSNYQRHPTAVIAGGAELADDVDVGPYAVVEDRVSIGAGTVIGPHAVIHSHARIGARNRIHAHAVIADTPQDYAYAGEATWVEIGDDNIIREGVTIHRSTDVDIPTRVGSKCFLMAYSHVAHGCQVSDGVILTNNVMLAGYVEVGAGAIIGGGTAVHQFCRVHSSTWATMSMAVSSACLPSSPLTIGGVPSRTAFRKASISRRSASSSSHSSCSMDIGKPSGPSASSPFR